MYGAVLEALVPELDVRSSSAPSCPLNPNGWVVEGAESLCALRTEDSKFADKRESLGNGLLLMYTGCPRFRRKELYDEKNFRL